MAGLAVFVGTYENYTTGYKVEPLRTDANGGYYLKEFFAIPNHTASVRQLVCHGKYLATGGADDRVCLVDLEAASLVRELMHHDGTVNTLEFSPDGDYLFSGSDDGTISAINVKKMEVEKIWKRAHKAAVLRISVHPEGRMALSLGSDRTLRTWDLVTGRTIFTTSLKGNAKYGGHVSDVQWSPDGAHFALVGNRVVDVLSIETTKTVRLIECDVKPVTMCWLSNDEIAVGLDDGHLLLTNVHENEEPDKLKLHDSRLKGVASVGDYLATVSSAGDVSLWTVMDSEFKELSTTNIGCRPTCIALALDCSTADAELDDATEGDRSVEQISLSTLDKVTIEMQDEGRQERGGRRKRKPDHKLKSSNKKIKKRNTAEQSYTEATASSTPIIKQKQLKKTTKKSTLETTPVVVEKKSRKTGTRESVAVVKRKKNRA